MRQFIMNIRTTDGRNLTIFRWDENLTALLDWVKTRYPGCTVEKAISIGAPQ